MTQPLVYEINPRCWWRDLSEKAGQPTQWGTIPASGFARWQQLGLTHIWLMGVWPTGPRSRAQCLAHADQLKRYGEILPDWREEDVAGSPFAVADYRVSEVLGGDGALQQFRRQLN